MSPVLPATEETLAPGGVIHDRVPAPSVAKNCPKVPVVGGKVKRMFLVSESGALNARKFWLSAPVNRSSFAVVPLPLIVTLWVSTVPVELKTVDPPIVPEMIASPETLPGVAIVASLLSEMAAVLAMLSFRIAPGWMSPSAT